MNIEPFFISSQNHNLPFPLCQSLKPLNKNLKKCLFLPHIFLFSKIISGSSMPSVKWSSALKNHFFKNWSLFSHSFMNSQKKAIPFNGEFSFVHREILKDLTVNQHFTQLLTYFHLQESFDFGVLFLRKKARSKRLFTSNKSNKSFVFFLWYIQNEKSEIRFCFLSFALQSLVFLKM